MANNLPHEQFRNEIEDKKILMKELMKKDDGTFEPRKETFDYNIERFKRKGKKNYHFITKAGKHFQDIMFQLCQIMYHEEEFPISFRETTLHMLWKRKGRADNLNDNRFLQAPQYTKLGVSQAIVVKNLCIFKSP